MANCSQSMQLGSLLDGELVEAARAAMESHLRNCVPCRQELEALQGLSRLLVSDAVPALTASAMRRIHGRLDSVMEQEAVAQRVRGRVLRIAHALSGIAACLLIAGAAWLYQGQHTSRSLKPLSVAEKAKPTDPWERIAVGDETDSTASIVTLSSMDSGSTLSVGGLLAPGTGEEHQ